MRYKLVLTLSMILSLVSYGQNTVSERISYMIPFLDTEPNKEQLLDVEKSLLTEDTLEFSLAISVLFKYQPEVYKVKMMDAFEIPYEDARRATVKKFYTSEEVSDIQEVIANRFNNRYDLKREEVEKVFMLYTFLEYRKRNVWTYENEHFSMPTTIAIRGGYLRGLLMDTMDYKAFISEMIARTNEKHE